MNNIYPVRYSDKLRWIVVANAIAFRDTACKHILTAATEAIARRGQFIIVLAGGDTPRDVYHLLREADTDWSRWHIYFGDERCLAEDSPERNSRMAGLAWLDHVAIPVEHVHPIPAEHGANRAALAYAETLRHVGDFDLVLLGLGEDGHTAGLFPEHDQSSGVQTVDTLAVLDAPEPFEQRVSMSARRLSHARAVLFLVQGESKQHAVRRWRSSSPIAVRCIQPTAGIDILLEASLLGG